MSPVNQHWSAAVTVAGQGRGGQSAAPRNQGRGKQVKWHISRNFSRHREKFSAAANQHKDSSNFSVCLRLKRGGCSALLHGSSHPVHCHFSTR